MMFPFTQREWDAIKGAVAAHASTRIRDGVPSEDAVGESNALLRKLDALREQGGDELLVSAYAEIERLETVYRKKCAQHHDEYVQLAAERDALQAYISQALPMTREELTREENSTVTFALGAYIGMLMRDRPVSDELMKAFRYVEKLLDKLERLTKSSDFSRPASDG